MSGKEGAGGRKADIVPSGRVGEVHPEAFQVNISDIMSDGCYSEGMKASFVQASVSHQQWKGRLLKCYMISPRD